MNKIECMLTQNDCYKQNRKYTPIGICVHTTGCKQTWLGRFVQPSEDDPNHDELLRLLGYNGNKNSWNRSGVDKAVHYMIGLLDDNKTIATIQTLPLTCRAWGTASGVNGSGNDRYIQFEMMEGTTKEYFDVLWKETVELCAYLCKEYGWTTDNITTHDWCGKNGYGSQHTDPTPYFNEYGLTIEDFKRDVQTLLGEDNPQTPSVIVNNYKRGDKVCIKKNVVNYSSRDAQGNLKVIPTWLKNSYAYLYVYSEEYCNADGVRVVKITCDETLKAFSGEIRTEDIYPYIEDVEPNSEPIVDENEPTVVVDEDKPVVDEDVNITFDELDEPSETVVEPYDETPTGDETSAEEDITPTEDEQDTPKFKAGDIIYLNSSNIKIVETGNAISTKRYETQWTIKSIDGDKVTLGNSVGGYPFNGSVAISQIEHFHPYEIYIKSGAIIRKRPWLLGTQIEKVNSNIVATVIGTAPSILFHWVKIGENMWVETSDISLKV